jgi:hypothetical protein
VAAFVLQSFSLSSGGFKTNSPWEVGGDSTEKVGAWSWSEYVRARVALAWSWDCRGDWMCMVRRDKGRGLELERILL